MGRVAGSRFTKTVTTTTTIESEDPMGRLSVDELSRLFACDEEKYEPRSQSFEDSQPFYPYVLNQPQQQQPPFVADFPVFTPGNTAFSPYGSGVRSPHYYQERVPVSGSLASIPEP